MSISLSEVEGVPVLGPAEQDLGRVRHVLFHPDGRRVAGLMVDPPAMAGVVKRRPAYLGLAEVTFTRGRVTGPDKLPGAKREAERLGVDPEASVIWMRMPAVTTDGVEAGVVSDAEFDPLTGELCTLRLSGGAASDIAVGAFLVDARCVDGYRNGAVRLSLSFSEVSSEGGLAKGVAKTAAVVSVEGGKAAAAAGEAVVKAAGTTGSAIRKVRQGAIQKRASGMWSELTAAFKEGYDEDEDGS